MYRKFVAIATFAFVSLIGSIAFGRTPAGQSGQASKDRSEVKSDGAKTYADNQEVKKYNQMLGDATAKTKQARQAWLGKVSAREAAAKSYGAKDGRTEQAVKDEAAAKQEYEADVKQQQDIAAQRKAAIMKAHGAAEQDKSDVDKMEKDGSKKPNQ